MPISLANNTNPRIYNRRTKYENVDKQFNIGITFVQYKKYVKLLKDSPEMMRKEFIHDEEEKDKRRLKQPDAKTKPTDVQTKSLDIIAHEKNSNNTSYSDSGYVSLSDIELDNVDVNHKSYSKKVKSNKKVTTLKLPPLSNGFRSSTPSVPAAPAKSKSSPRRVKHKELESQERDAICSMRNEAPNVFDNSIQSDDQNDVKITKKSTLKRRRRKAQHYKSDQGNPNHESHTLPLVRNTNYHTYSGKLRQPSAIKLVKTSFFNDNGDDRESERSLNRGRYIFTSQPTPVRVYISYAPQPKEQYVDGVVDSNGKHLLPLSRKYLTTGLIFDKTCLSFHPPLPKPPPIKTLEAATTKTMAILRLKPDHKGTTSTVASPTSHQALNNLKNKSFKFATKNALLLARLKSNTKKKKLIDGHEK